MNSQKMAKLTEHEVVPDVLSTAPASVAEVAWPSGAKAELGNVLTPTQVLIIRRPVSLLIIYDYVLYRFRMPLL